MKADWHACLPPGSPLQFSSSLAAERLGGQGGPERSLLALYKIATASASSSMDTSLTTIFKYVEDMLYSGVLEKA